MTDALPAGLRIGFVGAGRLGKALAWSLSGAGVDVTRVASPGRTQAAALVQRIPGCEAVDDAQRVVDDCDLVFVATPDGAIGPTASALRWRAGMAAVHCSGATDVGALHAAAAHGAWIGGFHPMQTFGDPLAAVAALPGSTITVEATEPLDGWLVALAGRLACRVNRLPPGMRARYHAAAGFTSQFINALFAEAARIWASWGASEADALRALMPLAHGTLASIGSAGIAGGMPGPVSRGDLGSVEKHVAALAGMAPPGLGAPSTLDIYRMLCRGTVMLAVERGSIDAALAARLHAALDVAPDDGRTAPACGHAPSGRHGGCVAGRRHDTFERRRERST